MPSAFAKQQRCRPACALRSLISDFVIDLLESVISNITTSLFPIFLLVSVTEETVLSQGGGAPVDRFSRDEVHLYFFLLISIVS